VETGAAVERLCSGPGLEGPRLPPEGPPCGARAGPMLEPGDLPAAALGGLGGLTQGRGSLVPSELLHGERRPWLGAEGCETL